MDSSNGIKDDTLNIRAKKLSDAEVEKLWLLYFKSKDNKESRDKLIEHYIYLTKYVVSRMRVNLPPTIPTDDIASFAIEGLINAIELFSPDKGARFETYAVMRIRGAIIDKIRNQDWVPRGAKQRYKKIQDTMLKMQVKLGRTPTTEEIANELGVKKEKIEVALSEMESSTLVSIYDSKDSSENLEIIDTIEDKSNVNPLDMLEAQDVQKDLSTALAKLPERERVILALYYHKNMTLKEIGEAVQISESRVCQLHAQAIMKLRRLLSNKELAVGKLT